MSAVRNAINPARAMPSARLYALVASATTPRRVAVSREVVPKATCALVASHVFILTPKNPRPVHLSTGIRPPSAKPTPLSASPSGSKTVPKSRIFPMTVSNPVLMSFP